MLALRKYTWLNSVTCSLCEKKELQLEDTFLNESVICKEMMALLPSKIDRMHYLGESSVLI